MDSAVEAEAEAATEGLRKMNTPIHADTEAEARQVVLNLNAVEEKSDKQEKDRKTFGRTPDGTGTWVLTRTSASRRANCS